MKRHVSLIVLSLEITAIVILHAVKMIQARQQPDVQKSLAKISAPAHAVKPYTLLSIK